MELFLALTICLGLEFVQILGGELFAGLFRLLVPIFVGAQLAAALAHIFFFFLLSVAGNVLQKRQ